MEQPQKKKLVLIIDDETDLVVALALRIGQAGFRVAAAGDGEEGLEKARFLRPDAIILDIAMPKLDGWSVSKQLRSEAAFKRTPIIVLTAWLTDDLIKKGDAAGVTRIMLKPFNEKELISTLRALCEPPARGAVADAR